MGVTESRREWFHSCAECAIMQCSGKRLPDWGFQQYEVVTDRMLQDPQVMWGVEDLSPPNVTQAPRNQTREEEEEEIRKSLSRRVHHSQVGGDGGGATLSFWEKYLELQVRNIKGWGLYVAWHVFLHRKTWPMPTVTWETTPSGLRLKTGH